MRDAAVTGKGDRIRWVEVPGDEPARVYLHGLGASSPPYYAAAVAHPLLAGRRSLLVDLLGFGISDRPRDFGYTLEEHADALAVALRAAGVVGGEMVAHSMGGSVAIVLAARHPELVSRLVVVDGNLDPVTPVRGAAGSSGIAAMSEAEFLAGGQETLRDVVGEQWWATMRLAGPEALYRSAVHLARATRPTMRYLLRDLAIPRTFLYPSADGPLLGGPEMTWGGVRVVPVPDCGHNIMLDAPDTFARLTAAALTTS
ncbi:alpha/beta fold hydrolase [Streptomyces sp. NRRL F-5126]|uniref:alpha/beta fold hydrolase n=1 Tax=Streptomyces sp. NRRL F-5126 TaxID=1463857 RepID=UPI0004CA1F80|nr:alpha/beta hydrolase [Streptomyces sp. NRRL F-5126]